MINLRLWDYVHNCKSVQNNRYIYTYTSNHTDANSSLVIVSGRPYTAFALPPSCLASLKLSCSLSNPLPPHLSLSLTNFTSSLYARPPRLLHRTDNPIPKIISTQPNSQHQGVPARALLSSWMKVWSVRCTACTVNCSHSHGHTRWAVLASNAMSADYELGRPTSYTYP